MRRWGVVRASRRGQVADERRDFGPFVAGHLGEHLRIGQPDPRQQSGEHRLDVDMRGHRGVGDQAPSAADVPQERLRTW